MSDKKEIKLFLLVTAIAPYYRSTFEHLRNLLSGLQIFVSTPMEANRSWKPDWGDLPVTVQRCFTLKTSWNHPQGFSDTTWLHIPYDTFLTLASGRPDVVVSLQLGIRTLQAVMYRRLFPNSRLVIWLGLSQHTERGVSSFKRLFRSLLLRSADAVFVNGQSGTEYLLGLGVPRQKILPYPYYADIAPHLRLPLEREPHQEKRLLYTGQLISRKGLMLFLSTLSFWLRNHPNNICEFWVAGTGPLRVELEDLAAFPNLKVRFMGDVAYDDLPGLYAQGGIFVFPTLADEWGVVVNESLAAGLPVLGSLYSQAVEELVRDGFNGWTFRPDRPDEMYAALDRAMGVDLDLLAAMRQNARNSISAITPQNGAQSMLRAIEFVLATPEKSTLIQREAETDVNEAAKTEA